MGERCPGVQEFKAAISVSADACGRLRAWEHDGRAQDFGQDARNNRLEAGSTHNYRTSESNPVKASQTQSNHFFFEM